MTYAIVLFLHSWLRWLIVAAAIWVFIRGVRGAAAARSYDARDALGLRVYISLLDTQFLLGILLYFVLSPLTPSSMEQFKAYMKDPALRFFSIEHVFSMVLALTLAHVGAVRVRKVDAAGLKHRRSARAVGFSLLAILVGLPWPFMKYGRPLFRWLDL